MRPKESTLTIQEMGKGENRVTSNDPDDTSSTVMATLTHLLSGQTLRPRYCSGKRINPAVLCYRLSSCNRAERRGLTWTKKLPLDIGGIICIIELGAWRDTTSNRPDKGTLMKNSYPHTLRPPSHAALYSRSPSGNLCSLSQAAVEAGRFAFLKGRKLHGN